MIQEIIEELALRHNVMVQISTGAADVTGGYGWHVTYGVKVIKIKEYCVKCQKNEGKDESDTAHPYNNHSWRRRETAEFNMFISYEQMIEHLQQQLERRRNT